MRVKSKYRQAFKDGGRINQPGQDELPIEQPTEAVSAPPEAPAPVDNPAPQPEAPQPEQPPHDDTATNALKRQIDSLRQSEHMQRQQAAQPQQQPTREQKLALWRQSGMTDGEADFLARHPQMIDNADILAYAVGQANQAGHQRDTDAHYDAVKKIFDAQVEHMMQQQAAPAMQQTPTPKFFAPPPPRPAPNPSARVSAPVSRSIPNASGKRHHSPGKITLTPSEVEAAKISGLTLEDYAKQKLEYERQREAGEYRDNREQR